MMIGVSLAIVQPRPPSGGSPPASFIPSLNFSDPRNLILAAAA